jgi:hypothetical protein
MMSLNSLDKLRETVPNSSQRFTTHGHNCATPEPKREDLRLDSITVNSKADISRPQSLRECLGLRT